MPNLPKPPHFSSQNITLNKKVQPAWVLVSQQADSVNSTKKRMISLQKSNFAAYTQQELNKPSLYQIVIGPELVKKVLLIEQQSLAKKGLKTHLEPYHTLLKKQLTRGLQS